MAIQASTLLDAASEKLGIDAFFGVPDSLLRALADELVERYGTSGRHVIAADEGGATALAAGHWLATAHPACVYMQNSGIGNAVNPICSLLDKHVYAIPVLFVVGWRGEPGVHDEPQHVFQGACSEELLKAIGLSVDIIDIDTSEADLDAVFERIAERFARGESAALLVRKGAVVRDEKVLYSSPGEMTREEALAKVVDSMPSDSAIVSTTGKLSRELYELREARGEDHRRDFLTVGSMGHSSMIGLGVALAKPDRTVVVLDGDGAALMHTGALAVLAGQKPENLVHIIMDNKAHESVGGMPTASSVVDWPVLAYACGYATCRIAETQEELEEALDDVFDSATCKPALISVRVSLGSRADLGRPTTTAFENGQAFQKYLGEGE